MKVTLINSTKDPVETLIFTKNTRLNMAAEVFNDVNSMTEDEKIEQLNYMVNTIKSSWEFVDFTFMIEGVSRAFTHQFVRNRLGSYAQQTMRILNVDGFEYVTGPTIDTTIKKMVYNDCMDKIQRAYNELIDLGVSIEDARGVLPTNICTNIVAKFNLRALSDMMASRSSSRTQGEYREVIEQMYNAVISEHEWAAEFLKSRKTYACDRIESKFKSDYSGTEELNHLIKLVDQVRNG